MKAIAIPRKRGFLYQRGGIAANVSAPISRYEASGMSILRLVLTMRECLWVSIVCYGATACLVSRIASNKEGHKPNEQ